MKQPEILSATATDAPFIAWIVAQGMHMPDVPPYLLPMCEQENTLYSWKHTRLLNVDGQQAGGLIAYDGAWHEEGRRNTWIVNGRLLSSGEEEETQAGEYYLDSLALLPAFRGQGLWRALFDDAVETARRLGFHQVALICDEDFPKLGLMYADYGFVPAKTTFQYFGTTCRKMKLTL